MIALVIGKRRLLALITMPIIRLSIPHIQFTVISLHIEIRTDLIIIVFLIVTRLEFLDNHTIHLSLYIFHIIFHRELMCPRIYYHKSRHRSVLFQLKAMDITIIATQFQYDSIVVARALKFLGNRIEDISACNIIVRNDFNSCNIGTHKIVTYARLKTKISSFVVKPEVELTFGVLHTVAHTTITRRTKMAVVIRCFLELTILDGHLVIYTLFTWIVNHIFVFGFISTGQHKLKGSLLTFYYSITAHLEHIVIVFYIDTIIPFPKEMSGVVIH